MIRDHMPYICDIHAMEPWELEIKKMLMGFDLANRITAGPEWTLAVVAGSLNMAMGSGMIESWHGIGMTGPVDDPTLRFHVQPDFARVVTVMLRVLDLRRDLLDVWEVMEL